LVDEFREAFGVLELAPAFRASAGLLPLFVRARVCSRFSRERRFAPAFAKGHPSTFESCGKPQHSKRFARTFASEEALDALDSLL
jgi:hypothetical protein